MPEPQKYRKKPAEVEAMQWDGTAEGATPIIQWVLDNDGRATYLCSDPVRCDSTDPHTIAIETTVGDMALRMRVQAHDWVIHGGQRVWHLFNPVTFAANYEPVEAAA